MILDSLFIIGSCASVYVYALGDQREWIWLKGRIVPKKEERKAICKEKP